MSMTGISNSYNNYVTQNTNDTTKKNVAKSNSRQVEFKEFNSEIKEPKLSTVAKNVLDEIRKTYGDMDIMVYEDGKDAKELLSRSTKEFTVMFSAEELEKMASGEKYKKQQINGIQGAVRMSEARAKREQKPVYINNDLFGGCYRRDWEGDYHCSKAEIKGMLRDAADETEDMKIVEQFDISAIDTESLKGFRNHHKSYRPEHVFNNLPDDEYLERIGAAGFGEDGKLHPTTAGLLMFGEEYHIVREFPEYFLDYREMLDPTIRWTDRLQSSSGDWSGNVFDFFFRVNSKIAKDIKKPFKLEGITRVDDTPVHKAVREALVNCLVNTDYFLPCGVVIKKEDDKLVIENPGSIRTGKKQMLRGGISDPRNKTLMKMFNMIGIGERAGSGIPDIYQVWENEGWPMPVVEESYNPDRTRLSLEFAKKQTIKTSEEEKEPKRSQKGAEKEPIKGAERKKEILKLIKVNSTITQVEIMKELDLTRKQVQKDMKELQEMHIIAREGTNRRGRWIIVKENK